MIIYNMEQFNTGEQSVSSRYLAKPTIQHKMNAEQECQNSIA